MRAATENFAAGFLRDVAEHELTVLRDNGADRHIRLRRPDSICMGFDLITWPGHLCFTGDMGTYVFARVPDMFEFFRRNPNRPAFQISYGYWAEKALAGDKLDGFTEFSAERFKADVLDQYEQHVAEKAAEGESVDPELLEEIESDVLIHMHDGDSVAWQALHDFTGPGDFHFDWEDLHQRHHVWTHRFLWCCHAIEWAIDQYDARTAVAA